MKKATQSYGELIVIANNNLLFRTGALIDKQLVISTISFNSSFKTSTISTKRGKNRCYKAYICEPIIINNDSRATATTIITDNQNEKKKIINHTGQKPL